VHRHLLKRNNKSAIILIDLEKHTTKEWRVPEFLFLCVEAKIPASVEPTNALYNLLKNGNVSYTHFYDSRLSYFLCVYNYENHLNNSRFCV
jgi:hypothetical protein